MSQRGRRNAGTDRELTPTVGEKYRALYNTFIETEDRERVLPLGSEITVTAFKDGRAKIIDERGIEGWIPMRNGLGQITIEMIPPEIHEPPPDASIQKDISSIHDDSSPKTLKKEVKKSWA